MTIYAWTIKLPNRRDIQHVTTLEELHDYLRILELPGVTTPEWVTTELETSEHGTFTHNEGSMDEWSLTWTKVDGETEVID